VQQPPPRRPASSDFGWSTSLASGAWLSRLTDGDTVDEAIFTVSTCIFLILSLTVVISSGFSFGDYLILFIHLINII